MVTATETTAQPENAPIYDYISIPHQELIEMCIERGLIIRPKIIREGYGWKELDKLWTKRELLDMLLEAQ